MEKTKQKIIVGIFIGFALSMTAQVDARGFGDAALRAFSKPVSKLVNRIFPKEGVPLSYSGHVLSKSSLRSCLNIQSRINDSADNLEAKLEDVDSKYTAVSIVLKSYQKDTEDMSQDIIQLEKNVDEKDAIISSYKKDIDTLDSQIQIEKLRVNVYDEQSVNNYNALLHRQQSIADSYNKLIDERNLIVERHEIAIENHNTLINKSKKLSDEYKAKVSDYNKGLEFHNSNINNYNQTCQHAYYEKDMQDILAESEDKIYNP